MEEKKPQIIIPESGEIGSAEVKKRFDRIDAILIAVVVAVIIALIAIVVAIFGIFLDQMRYNNAAYKEYSKKLDIQKELEENNDNIKLEISNNQKNIIEQQEYIMKILSNIQK